MFCADPYDHLVCPLCGENVTPQEYAARICFECEQEIEWLAEVDAEMESKGTA